MKKHMFFIFIFVFCFGQLLSADWTVSQKVVAADRAGGDKFGYSVAISNDVAIIGAYDEDQDANGENTLPSAGSAYIFRYDGTDWVQEQKIAASDRETGDWFGLAVDIEGDLAVVGAKYEDQDEEGNYTKTSAGAAYVFRYDGSTWTEEQKLVPSDRYQGDFFGAAVSLSGDAIVVGAYEEDEDVDGDNTISSAGSAYVFRYNGTSWVQEQKLVPDDRAFGDDFGAAVDIKGDTILIGAYQKNLYSGETLFATAGGAAYVYTFNGSVWSQNQRIIARDAKSQERFGSAVEISGTILFVSAYTANIDHGEGNMTDAGAVYVFEHTESLWRESQKLTAYDADAYDQFGRSISAAGEHLVVGVHGQDNDLNDLNTLSDPGSAYFYTRCDTGWVCESQVVSPIRDHYDCFGWDVGMSGNHALISSLYDNEDENEENPLSYPGSAYIFTSGTADTNDAEINITGNGIDIVNGDPTPSIEDDTDFGTIVFFRDSVAKTFTIQNIGTGPLNISTPVIRGLDSCLFSIIKSPADQIQVNDTSTFTIQYNPNGVGMSKVLVSIDNSDEDENPYTFYIQGCGRFAYSGGRGTCDEPFIISSFNDLLELTESPNDWDKSFMQSTDIDASASDSINFADHDSSSSTDPVALGFLPIGDLTSPFTGVYDGDGHTISNLWIYRPLERRIGLFGYMADSTYSEQTKIKNLDLKFIDYTGQGTVGGLIGRNYGGVVDSCYVQGNIRWSGNNLGGTMGGLIGGDNYSIISNCQTRVNIQGSQVGGLVGNNNSGKIVNCSAEGNVQGRIFAGGIVANTFNTDISNCYFDGDVIGYHYAGGLVGLVNSGNIQNCYTAGSVSGGNADTTGGFCGYVNAAGIFYGASIENCYSLGNVFLSDSSDITNHGFLGSVQGNNDFLNNFFNINTSGQLSDLVGAATPLDSLAMRNIGSFTNLTSIGLDSAWDFAYNHYDDAGTDDIWDLDPDGIINNGYPFLFWENGDAVSLPEIVGISDQNILKKFKLNPAYPNPFNPRTAISYQLSADSHVELNIYNVRGKLIDRLTQGYMEAGTYELIWNASDMPSGVYIVRMVAEDFIASQKMVLLK